MKYTLFLLMFAAGIVVTGSCKSGSSDNTQPVSIYSAQFYFKQISKLQLDVVYEAGAEPFVGTTAAGLNYWNITSQNLQAIFSGRSITLSVPKTLAEMRLIATQNRTVWVVSDALNLAAQVRNGDSSGSTGKIFIAFVKGYAANTDGSANTSVIGYSITGSNVILIFKQVIQAAGYLPSGPIPKFVEQSTIVHELAHAIGFVNNSLPMAVSHQDAAHGAHCSNPNCVMYYLNEGASDLASFIDKYKDSQNAVMFDDACLNDAKSF